MRYTTFLVLHAICILLDLAKENESLVTVLLKLVLGFRWSTQNWHLPHALKSSYVKMSGLEAHPDPINISGFNLILFRKRYRGRGLRQK